MIDKPSSNLGRAVRSWLARPIQISGALLIVMALLLIVVTTFATSRVSRDNSELSTEMHLVTGVVDGVQFDGTGICVRTGSEQGECYEAVNVLQPLPQVGQRVRMLYAAVPLTPEADARAYRIVAIEILPN